MRALTTCLLFLVIVAQGWSQSVPISSDLTSLAAEEAKRGVYVFYTQSFVDKENKRASYRGSVYGAIQEFELNRCELHIEAMIVDKFAGTVGKAPTGELQDTYRYSANLALTPEIAHGLSLIEARPAQLRDTTHSVCEQDSSCNFPWLRIRAKQRVIHETSTVNGALDFDGQVDHFVVPISSAEMGNRLMEQLQMIVGSRCR